MKGMDIPLLLESVRKLMRTILDPLVEYDRYCAFAAARVLISDLEDHLRERNLSGAHLIDKITRLKYHLRVIAGFENRGGHIEIHHYKFALGIINEILNQESIKPADSSADES